MGIPLLSISELRAKMWSAVDFDEFQERWFEDFDHTNDAGLFRYIQCEACRTKCDAFDPTDYGHNDDDHTDAGHDSKDSSGVDVKDDSKDSGGAIDDHIDVKNDSKDLVPPYLSTPQMGFGTGYFLWWEHHTSLQILHGNTTCRCLVGTPHPFSKVAWEHHMPTFGGNTTPM